MLRKRVIPTLLINDNRLLKGSEFKNHNYVGDPINIVKIFNEKYVDELLIYDINNNLDSSLNYHLLKNIAGECNMPLTYGGGIKNIQQVRELFTIGIEKVSINTNTLEDYNLIKNLSQTFGSQSIMVSIDIKKSFFGTKYIYNWRNKKLIKHLKINEHIENCIQNGAGEILINFVNNEGKLNGLNTREIDILGKNYKVPIIISGGINSIENIDKLLDIDVVDALGVGAYFIYHGPHKGVVISYYSPS